MGSGLGEPTQVCPDWVSRVMWYKQFICICKHHMTTHPVTGSELTKHGLSGYNKQPIPLRAFGLPQTMCSKNLRS